MDCSPYRQRNYSKQLLKFNFTFPGLKNIPRAPDLTHNRDLVDVHVAKKRLQLVHRLPVINLEYVRNTLQHTNLERAYQECGSIDRKILANLLAAGYSSVVDEIVVLVKHERILINSCKETGRMSSFTENPDLVYTLAIGLMDCVDAEKTEQTSEMVFKRKTLAEELFAMNDVWLARKMIFKALEYLKFYDDDELDKTRAELWCLMGYLCIYFEKSLEMGYDMPSKGLTIALNLSEGKEWLMPKSIIQILIPKPVNVYGLKNLWAEVDADWMNIYDLSSILMHVLYVKRAHYWQTELQNLELTMGGMKGLAKVESKAEHLKELETKKDFLKENVVNDLTSALAFSEKARLQSAFVATTLRRGLFFQMLGEKEKAMEDFNAMYLLSKSFDDRESIPIALNRMGHTCKMVGDAQTALEYFVNQFEVSWRQDLPELRGDALVDTGLILLEEGQTWEANECLQHSHSLFRNTKIADTPNELDDVTWAMLGVTGGQHLWGRYTTLIKSQEKSRLDAIFNWKSERRDFPIASLPSRWYQVEKCVDYEAQYGLTFGLDQRKSRHTKRYSPVSKRRFFQFVPSPVSSQASWWTQSAESTLNLLNSQQTKYFKTVRTDLETIDEEDDSEEKRRKAMIKAKSFHLRKPRESMWKRMVDPTNTPADRLKILLDDMDDESNKGKKQSFTWDENASYLLNDDEGDGIEKKIDIKNTGTDETEFTNVNHSNTTIIVDDTAESGNEVEGENEEENDEETEDVPVDDEEDAEETDNKSHVANENMREIVNEDNPSV